METVATKEKSICKSADAANTDESEGITMNAWALLFILLALLVGLLFGYGFGYDEGKKDGQKEKRHIDAKV